MDTHHNRQPIKHNIRSLDSSRRRRNDLFCPTNDGRTLVYIAEEECNVCPESGYKVSVKDKYAEPGTSHTNVLVTTDGFITSTVRVSNNAMKFRTKWGLRSESTVKQMIQEGGFNIEKDREL